MREFLRGGYRTLTEPTVVAAHGRPVFTVFPLGRETTVDTSLSSVEGATLTEGVTSLPERRAQ